MVQLLGVNLAAIRWGRLADPEGLVGDKGMGEAPISTGEKGL